MRALYGIGRAIAGGSVLFISTSVLAQTAPNDPRINQETGRKSLPNQANIGSVSTLNCGMNSADFSEIFSQASDDKNSFLINTFELVDQNGVKLDPKKFNFLYKTLDQFTGQQSHLKGLQAVAVKAQCVLRSKGHLLSAIRVPPQSFERTGANIILKVVLGYIANVDYRYKGQEVLNGTPNTGLSSAENRALKRVKSQFSKLTNPGPESDIDLERAVLLATRIPGVSVRPTLQKADGVGEGAINLVVDIYDFDKYRGDITLLNYSPKSLERWGPLLQVISNSQFVGGDQLKFSAYSSIDFKTQNVLRGSYSAPIARSDWSFTLSGSYGISKPGDALSNIALETESVVLGAEVEYPVLVRPTKQMNIYGGLEVVDQTLNVVGNQISNDQLSIAYAGVDGLFAWKNLISTYDLELRYGLSDVFGASQKGDTNLSRIGANPQALVTRLDMDTNIVLADKIRFHNRILAQYAKDPLLAYEEFAVGNFTIGRGYEPGQLSGDSGVGSSFELIFGPSDAAFSENGMFPNLKLEAFVFYDAAKIWNEDQFSEAERFVDSHGFGVTAHLTDTLSANVTFANATKKVFSFSQKAPGETLLFRTTWKF